jgi:uncharacterized protein YdgA (DUF945 family)
MTKLVLEFFESDRYIHSSHTQNQFSSKLLTHEFDIKKKKNHSFRNTIKHKPIYIQITFDRTQFYKINIQTYQLYATESFGF